VASLSLLTRLAGFGLSLLGAFLIGYSQGIQSIIGTIDHEITRVLGTTPGFAPALSPLVASYIQQNVTPYLNPYLGAGVATAAAGVILVARGDRRPKMAKEKSVVQPQSVAAGQ